MARRELSLESQQIVLTKSARRCCLCYGLLGDFAVRKGQVAHIDRDPSNSRTDNLVFLCLDHHDQYDSRTSQSKGFTTAELLFYRDLLYADVAKHLPRLETPDHVDEETSSVPLHDLLANVRRPQQVNSCLLNGYEIQKAIERDVLQIHPFDRAHLSTTGYRLSLGEQAFVSGKEVLLTDKMPLGLKPSDTAVVVTREVIVMPRGLVGRILPYYGSLWRSHLQNIVLDPMPHVDPGFRGRIILTISNRGSRTQALPYGSSFALIEFILINDLPFDWASGADSGLGKKM